MIVKMYLMSRLDLIKILLRQIENIWKEKFISF